VDIVLNRSASVRMNVGQVLETTRVAAACWVPSGDPVFDGPREAEIFELLKKASKTDVGIQVGVSRDGKTVLFGRADRRKFAQPVTVGQIYMMKLSTGGGQDPRAVDRPYSLITQQPLGGRRSSAGSFGEMEVWASRRTARPTPSKELLTVKSDDVVAGSRLQAIVKGENIQGPASPSRSRSGEGAPQPVPRREGPERDQKEIELKEIEEDIAETARPSGSTWKAKRRWWRSISIRLSRSYRCVSEATYTWRRSKLCRMSTTFCGQDCPGSPDTIRLWFPGEVRSGDDQLPDPQAGARRAVLRAVFGPTKDWSVTAASTSGSGSGIICDRCGVEVTRAKSAGSGWPHRAAPRLPHLVP